MDRPTSENGTQGTRIRSIASSGCEDRADFLAVEEPLEIRVVYQDEFGPVEQSASITMRTPGHDQFLATGFLFTEDILPGPHAIERVEVGQDSLSANVVRILLRPEIRFDPALLQRNFYTTSSCGVCGKASLEAIEMTRAAHLDRVELKVSASIIHALPGSISAAQSVFSQTGGLHAAGLFDTNGGIVRLHEDVGRHNAVDKVIGAELLAGNLPLHDRILMVSGRTSFEILQKALTAGIPLVAAVSAPSSLAVALAQEFGITLLGFVRDQRFNIYAHPERIVEQG